MNKLTMLISLVVLALLVGCGSAKPAPATAQSAVGCDSGNEEADMSCLRFQNERLARQNKRLSDKRLSELNSPEEPKGSEGGSGEAPMRTRQPAQSTGLPEGSVIGYGRVFRPEGDNPLNGVAPGFNFDVANHTDFWCEARSLNTMLPRGDAGTVVRAVMMPNGRTRPANLIPPKSVGRFYFDSLRGGRGPQQVTTVCFGGPSVDGYSALTPLVAVGTHTDSFGMPNVTDRTGFGRNIKIFSSDID
jgi:hypothetical protein